MERLKSVNEFEKLQERLVINRDPNVPTIVIPAGTCGQASGANDLIRVTKRELLNRKWVDKIHLRITGCNGFCQMEPSVLIEPQRTFYPKVSPKDMIRIVDAVAKDRGSRGSSVCRSPNRKPHRKTRSTSHFSRARSGPFSLGMKK